MATKQTAEEQEAPPVNKAPGKRPLITEKVFSKSPLLLCAELSKILFKKDASGKS